MRRDPTLTEPSPEADRAAMCAGKEPFASGALATKVAARRKYRGAEPYRCDHCGQFHIGRRRSTGGGGREQ